MAAGSVVARMELVAMASVVAVLAARVPAYSRSQSRMQNTRSAYRNRVHWP